MNNNCLICGTGIGWCHEHTPAFGDNVRVNGLSIYVGTIPFMSVISDRWLGLKPIKYWMGTDVLTMIMYPPHKSKLTVFLHRVKMRILNLFLHEHWIVSKGMERKLWMWPFNRKPFRYVLKPTPTLIPIKRVKHDGFNVLVYLPSPDDLFRQWLYGYDVVKWLMNVYPEINWIIVSGQDDMSKIYPIVDLYIRPTRHNGDPLMIQECKIHGIPYYWSENGKPEVHKIVELIKENGYDE